MSKCPKCNTEYAGELCPACAESALPELSESSESPKSPKNIYELLDTIHPNPYVRTTIKVVLMILLLGFVTLTVFFADFMIELFKGLF